jgi:hypothetical protein
VQPVKPLSFLQTLSIQLSISHQKLCSSLNKRAPFMLGSQLLTDPHLSHQLIGLALDVCLLACCTSLVPRGRHPAICHPELIQPAKTKEC